jgi:phenylalanyl-tRNA synthetase beta chain
MKFSESWLRQYVNPKVSTKDLVSQMTMAGLEIDSVERAAPDISGVIVGQIVKVEPHPNADKLSVCQVSSGDDDMQVVCGAPNARLGIKVPFARVGAVLPGDFKIKKAKLRGIESFGMLCAQDELGLGEDASGLWELPEDAEVGCDLIEFLELDDNIIEVDLTPNRGDCLSILGLSREVGVLNSVDIKNQDCLPVKPTIEDVVDVQLDYPEGCARYVGRVVRNLDLNVSTPGWMQECLRRSGLRSLGPAVDVTNYVLLEMGQPMHAFDLSSINGSVTVRMGEEEPLSLLDDSEVTVDKSTLVIADNEKVLALAGIMGGSESSVSSSTTDIFFESAWFNPLTLAGKARYFGKHTDSSHRFERGVDSELQVPAIERATALILEICGGLPGPVVISESSSHLPKSAEIKLRDCRLEQQLGVSIPADEVDDMLVRLGLVLVKRSSEASIWMPPSWRFDLVIEQDLIEEVARIYGYNNLPTSTPIAALDLEPCSESKADISIFRAQLVSRGYQEVITYTFVDPELQSMVDSDSAPVALVNPISNDMSVMRTNLWSGLLATASHNLNRQQSRVRIFEIGQCFVPTDDSDLGLVQSTNFAGLVCGPREPVSWSGSKENVDFYDIKGDLQSVFAQTGLEAEFRFIVGAHSALHPGQSAKILRNGEFIGWIGQIHPKVQSYLGLHTPVYVFQVSMSNLTEVKLPFYEEVSKFPEVRRDLAFYVDREIAASELMSCAKSASGEHLIGLKLFDVYQPKDIDNKGKSVALGLTFQHPSRTLTDEEVNQSIESVVSKLKSSYGAELR